MIRTWSAAEEFLAERHLVGTRIIPLWESYGSSGLATYTFAVRPPADSFRLEQVGPRGGHTSFLRLSAEREALLRDVLVGGRLD